MLFNSAEFLFLFLPIALAGFYFIGNQNRGAALLWLTACSLVFYAVWRPLNVLLIAPSIAINYILARILLAWSEKHPARGRLVLIAGIIFNLCFLGYFKYMNFFREVANDTFGAGFVMEAVVLPLGISFITFQKIAFLVDVHVGRVSEFRFRDYALFVLFFPQLIAGPIVHYREMMPQFATATCRFVARDTAVGLSLLVLGLFKKLVLADAIAPMVSPIYASAGSGVNPDLFTAWMAALGFTLQIYFDFSGYTDMAIGLARCFGIRLPANFNSPLKATGMIDYWSRWHMTLTRFLTAYLYNPVSLAVARRRMAAGKPAFSPRNPTLSGFIATLAAPTLLTMLVSGIWHGAGYTFLVWGLLHGLLLCVNHAWRFLRKGRPSSPLWTWPLTFICVAVTMVIFRAPTLTVAGNILAGMAGLHHVALPAGIMDRLGSLGTALSGLGVARSVLTGGGAFLTTTAVILGLTVIVLALPNTMQLLAAEAPALGIAQPKPGTPPPRWVWQPDTRWAIALSLLAAAAVLCLSAPSEFLYWKF